MATGCPQPHGVATSYWRASARPVSRFFWEGQGGAGKGCEETPCAPSLSGNLPSSLLTPMAAVATSAAWGGVVGGDLISKPTKFLSMFSIVVILIEETPVFESSQ